MKKVRMNTDTIYWYQMGKVSDSKLLLRLRDGVVYEYHDFNIPVEKRENYYNPDMFGNMYYFELTEDLMKQLRDLAAEGKYYKGYLEIFEERFKNAE